MANKIAQIVNTICQLHTLSADSQSLTVTGYPGSLLLNKIHDTMYRPSSKQNTHGKHIPGEMAKVVASSVLVQKHQANDSFKSGRGMDKSRTITMFSHEQPPIYGD